MAVTQTVNESIQERNSKQDNVFALPSLIEAGLYMPRWWSPSRDRRLSSFWRSSDHLAGAIYTLQSKMVSIPPRVIAKNPDSKADNRDADRWFERLLDAAEFGDGWDDFYKKWLETLLTQDNGAFAEIIGAGDKTGPIKGPAISIASLDSSRCIRTGDPVYPVLYTARSGKKHRLHFSRVMFASQMPSSIRDMNSVGFCAVSRAINVAQTLVDILNFKQEKLGSRPHRSILITRGGLDPRDVQIAFEMVNSIMDDQGMSRYSKVAVVGSSSLKDAGMDKVELSSLPDGFDEESSVVLGMATIALAFGVDARELFPAVSSSASKADALLQHMKQRRKGPGEIMRSIEKRINNKFLPPHLELVFDYQDDAQDRQVAEIQKLRADKRVQDASSGVVDVHVSRTQMLDRGEISRIQFAELELNDGRLMDGSSVLTLFYKDSARQHLNLGTDDPLNKRANDEESIRELIRENSVKIATKLVNTKDDEERIVFKQCLSALKRLEEFYKSDEDVASALLGNRQFGDTSFVDGRVRSDAPLSPGEIEESNEGNRERSPDVDGLLG